VDIVARYGGEEFAVILPDATRDAAKTAADRMLWTVSRHRFATGSDGTPWWSLTISVGGALYPDDAKSRAELIDRADRVALYAAKRSGKNRVVLWSDTAPSE
jgi:diguanylate cyclase (GGDEF)-like protein